MPAATNHQQDHTASFRCVLLGADELHAVAPGLDSSSLVDFAEALVGSAPWQHVAQPAAVAVSVDPPRLALIGRFSKADDSRLSALRSQLDIARRRLRYVGYAEAERLAAVAADRLTDQVGRAALAEAQYLAVPRGGHVVLGLLAYSLDVGRNQLDSGDADLWIVVDDCSISGARFLQWLDDHPGPEVVFVHLYSHPELRRRLEQHPRVRACVAADDLHDHAPDRLGDGYHDWLAAWTDRDSGVWAGQMDRVAFAWNEPDTGFWNEVTEQVEAAWHLIGPSRCVKNRGQIPQGSIQLVPHVGGELRPGDDTIWVRLGEEVVVADVASGAVLGLAGTAAVMWLEAMAQPTKAATLQRLGVLYDAKPARLAADFEVFVESLVAAGVAEDVSSQAGSGAR